MVKFFTRRFLLILMMLWLPVQGVVAASTPHCAHQSNADMDHQQPMDGNMTANQGCEVNTLCHASCGTLISTAYSTSILVSNSSAHQSRNVNTVSFIPDLPQHPPRA